MPVAAIPAFWGAVGTIGGGLAAGALSSHGQSKAADTQAKSQEDAAQLQAQAAKDALAFEQQQAAQARADSIAAQNANAGQWGYHQNTIRPYQQGGLNAFSNLSQLLGLPATSTDLPDLPPPPSFANAGGQQSAAAPSTNASYSGILSALNSGKSPQDAIADINKQGAVNGESYAWRSIADAPGGGVVEVPGSRGSYLTKNTDGSWKFVQGNDGGQTAQNIGGLLNPNPPKPMGAGQQLSVVPGSIGSLLMA